MQAGWIVAGVVLVAGATGLSVAARTRWMQSDTLKKCVLLSVAAHAVLAAVAACLGGVSPASWGTSDEGRVTMVVVVSDEPEGEIVAVPGTAGAPEAPGADAESWPESPVAADAPAVSPAPVEVSEELVDSDGGTHEPMPVDLVPLLAVSEETPSAERSKDPYAMRRSPKRVAEAVAHGGSQETERAVARGLAWLSRAQSSDGRWDASRHGAGVERTVQGHHRSGAGARSDHGVTGLALLALLGGGSTHRDGPHAAEVARGIDFLVRRQKADGSLAGDAEFFAALYCHGMATIALGEACAMSGDERLREPLARAIAHTLSKQSPSTGGWRYAAGDRGDTSQLGWQVMAIHAARNAGLDGLDVPLERAGRFLASVSSGAAGGLASYRPRERPSVAMTAEALFCRLLLGLDPAQPLAIEAVAFIDASALDASTFNAYACYYATLAMFHAGGPAWERWNARLQRVVLPLQRSDGDAEGSWDPDAVWGGHGGRVYSTALSVMMLEVYYRYLPMHRGRNGATVAVMPAR